MEPVIYNNQIQLLNAAGSAVIEPPTLASVQALLSQTGFDAKLDVALSTRASETTLANLNSKVVACDTGAVVISSGTVTANIGTIAGIATESTLSAINGKITACDTGAVVVSSGTVTANLGTIAGVATETTLSSLNSKVVACDTGAVVISSGTLTANLGTIAGVSTETTLASLNSKVVACDTGAVVISSGSVSASVSGTVTANLGSIGAVATESTLATGLTAILSGGTARASEVTLASLNSKVTACDTGAVVISGGSVAVTNAGTFAVQVDGAALTALQLLDDAIFTDDAAFTPGTSKVGAIGFILDEVSPDAVDEGDIGAARMNVRRAVGVGRLQAETADLDNINVLYDDSPTTATTSDVDCDGYGLLALSFLLQSANTPTTIQFILEFKDADGNYVIHEEDGWARFLIEDAEVASQKGIVKIARIPPGKKIVRVRVVAVGTTASNTFTVSEAKLGFSTV